MHEEGKLITAEEFCERCGDVYKLNKKEVATHDEVEELFNDYFCPTYKMEIDQSIADSADALTYLGNYEVGWNYWKNKPIFKDIKPCVLKNGKVQYYLNPDNYTKKINGDAANLNGVDGDVMVEFPFCGYKFSNVDDNKVKLELTTKANQDGFCYLAHSLDSEGDCNKIYIGAYLNTEVDNKLHSYSNETIKTSINISEARENIASNGVGYQLLSFYPWTLIQVLYLFVFKNRDSQSAIGRGASYSGSYKAVTTGTTNTVGMNGNTDNDATTGKKQVKCLGLEDLWGMVGEWCDGLYIDSSYTIWTDYNNFASRDPQNSYRYHQNTGMTNNSVGTGYLKIIQGNNNGGFLRGDIASGSDNTYWCDYSIFYVNCFGVVGGTSASGFYPGLFCSSISYSISAGNSYIATRLVYKSKS